MEGISKKRLKAILHNQILTRKTQSFVQYLIEDECKELQEPWIPVDENTPKDRPILLFYPEHKTPEGRLNGIDAVVRYNEVCKCGKIK